MAEQFRILAAAEALAGAVISSAKAVFKVCRDILRTRALGRVLFIWDYDWRDGRVVEGARLESVYRGNSIEGSNPSLSASLN